MPIYKDKKLLFIHIPKNAGTSVSLLLDKSFNAKPTNKGVHKAFKDFNDIDDYAIFAILRDPIDRAMSHYRWFRESTDYKQYPHKRIAVRHTFEDWLNIWYIPKSRTQFHFISVNGKFYNNITLLYYEDLKYELNYYLNDTLGLSVDVSSIGNNKRTNHNEELQCSASTLNKIKEKESWLYDNDYY